MVAQVWQKLADYLRGSWQEMKRVSWPTRVQSVRYTLIVLGITVVVMIYLGALDALFSWLYFQASIYFAPQSL